MCVYHSTVVRRRTYIHKVTLEVLVFLSCLDRTSPLDPVPVFAVTRVIHLVTSLAYWDTFLSNGCHRQILDSDWRSPTKSTLFDHTFREPGKYTFQVQAINRDLQYSEPESMSIVVSGLPFHRTGAFLIVLSLMGGASLVAAVVLGMHRWRMSQVENLRLQSELEDARQTQLRLLPERAPAVEGFDIAGFSSPAREVGGDFFNYLSLADGKVGITLAEQGAESRHERCSHKRDAQHRSGKDRRVVRRNSVRAELGSIPSNREADVYRAGDCQYWRE